MIVAIDFDGTIANSIINDEYEMEIKSEVSGSIEAIKILYENDHKLILWTCRCDKYLDQAVEWLKENNIYHCFSAINDQCLTIKNHNHWKNFNTRKIHADIYIDDKNFLGFPGWSMIIKTLI
jgi:hypothetical protein